MRARPRRFAAKTLRIIATDILQAAGAPRDRAKTVADHLVSAHLAGHDSHGVQLLPIYCRLMAERRLQPRARIRLVHSSPGMDVFDGGSCFGQVVALTALTHALRRVKRRGTVSVAFRNSCHIGRLGYYAEIAVQQDCMVLMTANAIQGNHQAHPDCGVPLLGTNPICFAVRWKGEFLLLDMATSVRAEGKVILHKNAGKKLPAGWLRDNRGRPTRNPDDLWTTPPGSLWPLGGPVAGYKGFGLALMVDLLAGLSSAGQLAGSDAPKGANNGWIHLIHLPTFAPARYLDPVMERWLTRLRSAPTLSGDPQITLPGDPEARAHAERSRDGIEIPAGTWTNLEKLACTLQASLDEYQPLS